MRRYMTLVAEMISNFSSFNISPINRGMNTIVYGLAMYASHLERYDMGNKPDGRIITLYRPHLPNNDEFWKVFEDDDTILSFLKGEAQEALKITNLKKNRYPKGLSALEDTFSPSDSSKTNRFRRKFSKVIDET